MDTDDQPDASRYGLLFPWQTVLQNEHFSLVSPIIDPIQQYHAHTLYDGVFFITSQGTHLEENIPSSWKRPVEEVTEIFLSLENLKEGSTEMLTGLIQAYADLYKIHLFVILATEPNCTIFNNDRILEDYAFLLRTEENKFVYLFYQGICEEKLTTFGPNERHILPLIEKALEQPNRIGISFDRYPFVAMYLSRIYHSQPILWTGTANFVRLSSRS